ncbi:MAG: hypothetical protein ACXACI_13285 [Candidatus Hodarchaeales archaeon]
MLANNPPSLETEVTRTYRVGMRFNGVSREERRHQEREANKIIRELQQAIREKITPERLDQTITLLREEPALKGTTGAAYVGAAIKDRSNLGQVTCLTMLNAAKGVLDRERKLETFLDLLENDPVARVEWFVLGRTPYVEQQLARALTVKFDYARNLVLGARRTLDQYLTAEHQLRATLPLLTEKTFRVAIEAFYQTILHKFNQCETLTKRQCGFQRKITRIYHQRKALAPLFVAYLDQWNHPSDNSPKSRWKALKGLCREGLEVLHPQAKRKPKATNYLSAFRGILISALLPNYGSIVSDLREDETLRPEHLVVKPFQKKKAKGTRLIPLSLVMGRRYVVGRPGNGAELTRLARDEGKIAITIWRPRQHKHAIPATIRFHSKLRHFLRRGAQLQLLILTSGPAPAEKLTVAVVLKGAYRLFLSRKALQQSPFLLEGVVLPVVALGVDVNRVSPHVLAFSEDIPLPVILAMLNQRYIKLGGVLADLHTALTRAEAFAESHPSIFSQRRLTKLRGELQRVYRRRKRLLAELHRECGRLVSRVLLQGQSSLLCVEDLSLSARGARGALAKAILNMPDDLDLYERSVLVVEWLTSRKVSIQRVSPYHTSQGPHVGCPASVAGYLRRRRGQWDFAECSACHQLVNSHRNAAKLIRDRGTELYSGSLPCHPLSAVRIPAALHSRQQPFG